MFRYTGRDDTMRATKDNLSADAIDKRIRLLIKIPRELHVHVCNKDINMNGSGTALEALEEASSETLVGSLYGTTDPEAASERKLTCSALPRGRGPLPPPPPNAPRSAQLLLGKRRRRRSASSLSIPATKANPTSSNSSSLPARKPSSRVRRKVNRLRLLSCYPEVEVPPKPHPPPKPDPKDVINLDDLPEDPIGHGDSGKGASSSAPPPDQPSATFAGPTEEEYEQKVQLIHASSTLQANPQPAPSLQKQETAKHSSFDDLSAKVKVLEAENESLKAFIKESSDKENEARKELSEKHAREVAEWNDKLKKSQSRVTSLVAKNKVQEAEAEAIDKLIFPSLGFEWTKESNLKRTEAYDARCSIDAQPVADRQSLSLKRAKTSVIDTMTKLMEQVPEFIKDWQESSARGVASLVLATCKAHFPALSFADVARSRGFRHGRHPLGNQGYEQLFVRRVNHSFWYHKYDLPKGFSDAEEEEGEPEYYAEGSGSSIERSGEGSDDDSEAGSGDSDDDGSAYQESEEEDSE
ncbi:hypothetical protein QYE76_009948 [Lolium multiflorum]|uniref:Uncharacterized protein n=1 Tax=Lolium multiflorum TaxID=4521 RepID=A0AAD8TU24_LOLMU|nr:hypothetical protein QYE76_009948 [Lolium multiflorum]